MSTLEAPAPAPSQPRSAENRGRGLARKYPEIPVGLVLLLLSTVLVVWARTRPGFDPYGWLVWGHQTVHWALNTNAAPSWKPLPYLFLVPFGVFGHFELWLWMIFSVAVALAGVLFAGLTAYRLTAASHAATDHAPAIRGHAPLIAGLFAAAALLGIRDYWHYILSYQSDPMIVSLCLGAIYYHLVGRPRWAFVLGALASLGRPEVWLFFGLYAIWAWLRVPSMRWMIGVGIALVALLWFGIPALTSRSAFVAGSNALGSGRALHSNKVFGTIDRFLDMHETPLELAALLAVAFAVWRRDRATLALAGGAVAWVVVEIAFSVHGWPGLPRYMFAAGAMTVVLAGVAVGRLLAASGRLSSTAGWAGAAVALAVAIGLVPAAISRARVERRDLKVQRLRTKEIDRLAATVNRYGGPGRFHGCGEPLTRLEYQTIVAWTLQDNVATVGFKYGPAIRSGRPIVLFTPHSFGWTVQALHQRAVACRSLALARHI